MKEILILIGVIYLITYYLNSAIYNAIRIYDESYDENPPAKFACFLSIIGTIVLSVILYEIRHPKKSPAEPQTDREKEIYAKGRYDERQLLVNTLSKQTIKEIEDAAFQAGFQTGIKEKTI